MGKKKKKKSSGGGGGSFVVVLVLFVVLFFLFTRETKPVEYVTSLSSFEDPVQTKTTGSTTVNIDGQDIKLDYVASYSISGIVINMQSYYNKDIRSDLAPMDVGIAWGKVAENLDKLSFRMTAQGFLDYSTVKNTYLNELGGDREIISHYSNNRLIPSTPEIEKNFLLIREGDAIKIEGYLVNASGGKEKDGSDFSLDTSTVRTDAGNSGAETIYITKLVWLEEKTY